MDGQVDARGEPGSGVGSPVTAGWQRGRGDGSRALPSADLAPSSRNLGENTRAALRWLVTDRGSLKQQVAQGWMWLFLGETANRLVSLLKLATLGHLLSPHDYGVFGVAALLHQWLSYFSQTGLDAALIQKRGQIQSYLDAYWTSQVLRGCVLALLLFVGAPVGAAFFHSPEATPVIRLFGLGAGIYGLRNPGVVYLRKDLCFQKDAIWRLTGSVVGLAVAIPLAVLFRSVWALALSVVAADAAETATSYWIHPYRPRLCLSWRRLRELTGFSKWIVTSNALGFLQQYMDSLAVGRLAGALSLGLYQVAGQVAFMPTSQIGNQMRAVLFPAFSKMNEVPNLRRAFLAAFTVLCTLSLPAAGFLTVFGEPVVRIVLGPKWLAAVPFLRILVWAGVLKALASLTTALLMAAGKPRLAVQASLIDIAVFALLAYPLMSRFGAGGSALGTVISCATMVLYHLYAVRLLIQVPLGSLSRCGGNAVLATLPFFAVAPLVDSAFTLKSYFLAAAALGVSLVIVYTAIRAQCFGHTNGAPLTAIAFAPAPDGIDLTDTEVKAT